LDQYGERGGRKKREDPQLVANKSEFVMPGRRKGKGGMPTTMRTNRQLNTSYKVIYGGEKERERRGMCRVLYLSNTLNKPAEKKERKKEKREGWGGGGGDNAQRI